MGGVRVEGAELCAVDCLSVGSGVSVVDGVPIKSPFSLHCSGE